MHNLLLCLLYITIRGVEEHKGGEGSGSGDGWKPLKGAEGWSFHVEHYKELQDRFFGIDRLADHSQVTGMIVCSSGLG